MAVILLDLLKCTVGMTCDEFSTLITTEGNRNELSESVQKHLTEHEKACAYHRSSGFYQSMLGVTPGSELEADAKRIIEKYS